MDLDTMEDATGMPSRKKTHRGKRSRGHGSKPAHLEHHAQLNAAMDEGDHASAKKSALSLVKALHALAPKKDAVAPLDPAMLAP